jgi:hypothetical protein
MNDIMTSGSADGASSLTAEGVEDMLRGVPLWAVLLLGLSLCSAVMWATVI